MVGLSSSLTFFVWWAFLMSLERIPMKTDKSQTIAYLKTNYAPYKSVRIVTKGTRKKKKDGTYKLVPADSGKIYGVEKLLYDLYTAERFEAVIRGFNPQVGAWISAHPTTGQVITMSQTLDQ